jgi:hypothetical protein
MKKWYESKLVWLGIFTTMLGVLPVVFDFVKGVQPDLASILDSLFVMISGIVAVVIRIWFTDKPIG